jgi:hypothetical protein
MAQNPPIRSFLLTLVAFAATLASWEPMASRASDAADGSSSAEHNAPSQRIGTGHWAYQPIRGVKPPEVRDESWPRNPIDRFILARLEGQGLEPVADAERAVLAWRLQFDLTGLPTAPEDIDAFVNDRRPEALEALVSRLLASPRFGEHWARHWLDIVRYGESVTLRGLVLREAWRYRDFVIDAFNEDLPLNHFIRAQLAGDLLPATTLETRQRQHIATTFLMLGNTNLEEQDKRQLEMDVIDEQLEVIGKAFLGQTIACARCHDHKFDPIPATDYYALAGILKNVVTLEHANVSGWVERPLPLGPSEEAMFRRHESAIEALEARIRVLRTRHAAPAIDATELAGQVIDSASARTVGEWKLSTHTRPYIGDGYLHDLDEDKGAKTLTFAFNPTHAGSYEVRFAYTPGANRATHVPVTVFHAGGETLLTINQQQAPPLEGRFISLGIFRFETDGFAHVLIANEGTRGHVIADAVQLLPIGDGVPNTPASLARREEDSAETTLRELEARLKTLRESAARRPMIMAPREDPAAGDLPVYRRGSVHAPGETVPRGFLSVADVSDPPEIAPGTSGRAELAEWITRPDNPLTARVQVNRIWLWLMGEGLVRTPDNFGMTGAEPSHPELLDWLAARLARPESAGGLGWSTKSLIREIVLSRTYQLASAPSEALMRADPENHLLGRANRRPLAVEQLRDAMLAIAGTLRLDSPRGPTFPKELKADFGFVSDETRRSIYLPVFRNALPSMFETFDFPSPSMVTGRRDNGIVPTQSLFLLNDRFVRDQAMALAKRLDRQFPWRSEDPALIGARIRAAYRWILGRRPDAGEERALTEAMAGQPGCLETWTDLAHALLASAEFRYLN